MSRPIFIVGSPRSGTSVLTWAIGQHPNILTVPETDWKTALASWAGSLYQIGMAQHPAGHLSRWDVSRESFLKHLGKAVDAIVLETFEEKFPNRRVSLEGAIAQSGLAWFRSVDDPKVRWVDGTPSCTGYAGVLAAMFPEAQFINLVRDPASVVQSLMGASFRQPGIAETNALLENIYHSQKAGYLTHAAFGERTKRVIFEELIGNPKEELREIFHFLGEEYSPESIEPLANKINSSGETNNAVRKEYASIADTNIMQEIKGWYISAGDSEWRIEADAGLAAEKLSAYACHKIPMGDG